MNVLHFGISMPKLSLGDSITERTSLIDFQYMQEGNPYYNLYNNDGAAAAAAYSYASAGGGTSGSSCAKEYKDYKDYSYYGSYFNQVSCFTQV